MDDCIRTLRQGGLSEAEAQEVVDSVQRRVRTMDDPAPIEDRVAAAIKELKAERDAERAIIERNALLTLKASKRAEAFVSQYDDPVEGFLDFLEGGQRLDVEGAGRGTDTIIKGHISRDIGQLLAHLEKEDLLDGFVRGVHDRDIFLEAHGQDSGNPKAKQIREIAFGVIGGQAEKLNLHGAFIRIRSDYLTRQAYGRGRLLQKFGPDRFRHRGMMIAKLTPQEDIDTFNRFKAFMLEHTDHAITFGDADPDEVLKSVYDNVFGGKGHGSTVSVARGANINLSASKTGSLAKSASKQRVLHFKDGASAFAVHEALAPESLAKAVFHQIEHQATNLGLMQSMGPSPKATLDLVLGRVQERFGTTPGGRDKSQTLQRGRRKIETSFRFLTGEAKRPETPSIHTFSSSVIKLIAMSKLGKLLLHSFSDRSLMAHGLIRNGVAGFDALRASLSLTNPKDPKQRQIALMLGGGAKSILGSIHNRFTIGTEGVGVIDKLNESFFKLSGINYMDDIGTNAIALALPRHLGSQADLPMSQIHPELRTTLRQFDISDREWDAMRSTVYTIHSGTGEMMPGRHDPSHQMVTPDQFDRIPKAQVDALLKSEGVSRTANNRARKRIELENKYHAWLTAQRDSMIIRPGAREERIAAGGTQAGTPGGAIVRLLMMFKQHPIAVYQKILKREMHRAGARNFLDWVATGKVLNFHTLGLIASTTAAGYIPITIDEFLQGKTPRKLINDDGSIHPGAAKTMVDAFQRGGAGSLYADLLLRQYDGAFKTLARTAGGPALGAAEDLAALVTDPSSARAVRFTKSNLPFANLVYVKPALDVLLWNHLAEMTNPGTLRRLQRQIEKEHGQEYWNRP